MFRGRTSGPPTRRHLRHWEAVCRYLDSFPYRSIRWPYAPLIAGSPLSAAENTTAAANGATEDITVPLISTRLLKRMATYRLVHHTEDCSWRLSLRWRAILARLLTGASDDEVVDVNNALPATTAQPFVADQGVDTWYVHLYGESLADELVAACDQYKQLAQEADQPVETPWRFFGAPLSMYKAGVGTAKKDKGVSWSFVLRNAYVMLLLRRTPLVDLFGSVRLSAECLWTHGPQGALDGMRRDVDALWATTTGNALLTAPVTYKVSQIHLCADIANWSPSTLDLTRVTTRSLKKAIYLPAPGDVAAAAWADEAILQADPWLEALAPPEWEGIPLDLLAPTAFSDALADDDEADEADEADGVAPREDLRGLDWAEDGEAAVYLWGQRASGFAFSPGTDLSAVWYDKALEERRSGKRWMEAIHQAGGWDVTMPITRVEARFRRGALRDLTSARVSPLTAPEEAPRWFGDPWECLEHLNDLWTYFAGLPPESDSAPDVTYRGWLRLLCPVGTDTNRARWRTDPLWELVQRVQFTPTPAKALKRVPLVRHDLRQVDAELYGLLKLRAALRGEYLDTTATLSLELRAFAQAAEDLDATRGRDFAEEVREKARKLGRPVPMRARSLRHA